MNDIGQRERKVQNRVMKLFQERLGYRDRGSWQYHKDNSNIEVDLLTQYLRGRGYDDHLIDRALLELRKAARVGAGHGLGVANEEVHQLLRYGVVVPTSPGEPPQTIALIDWNNPQENDFSVAEEVTVHGEHTKRPDIVLYVNGLALATIELKRSLVFVEEGIRQTIGNQKDEFIAPFFSTVQLVFAGNDSQGLRYGVVGTKEKHWAPWHLPRDIDERTRGEIEADTAGIAGALDTPLAQMCAKERFLDLLHNFIVFDSGVKKACRPSQYFGVKAAQKRVARREGGIIWHSQGSGKSLTMVWLAKWLLEKQPDARVLIITDRIELDEQIEQVFKGVKEKIYRTRRAVELLDALSSSPKRLICSLVHKFRGSEDETGRDEAGRAFLEELDAKTPKGFKAKGNLFVFVDEAHRTQSGSMHKAMKRLLPGAMFIGFTGTPLLKADRDTTMATFGSFIHTYKFDEAVADGVVLDLCYEARNINQRLTSPEEVDKSFEARTAKMSELAKAELKKRWGTIQRVTSSAPRAGKIVADILRDMEIKPRLADGRGNAIIAVQNIYQACTMYRLFCEVGFQDECAIITSYVPKIGEMSKEDSGEGKTEKMLQYEVYREMLSRHLREPDKDAAMKRLAEFELSVKKQFKESPGKMRLLIVVDKLLTGFDAPSATYLYIDKSMSGHGLFQAICRVNRLDEEDKEYGYIVDYRDLFKSLESAVIDYTSDALGGYDKKDVQGLLGKSTDQARRDLDEALEQVRALVEPVAPPKEHWQYRQYFCETELGDAEQLKVNEPKRAAFYKAVATLARAYGRIASKMTAAGYTPSAAKAIKEEVGGYVDVSKELQLGAAEDIDLKRHEPWMRFLLDTYIEADAAVSISNFENLSLIELIVKLGPDAVGKLPKNIRKDPKAAAASIAANIRKTIVEERATNPAYYEKMSELLDAVLEEQRKNAISYKELLDRLLELAKQVGSKVSGKKYPEWVDDGAKQALIDIVWLSDDDARELDAAIRRSTYHDWVGNERKEKFVRNAIKGVMPSEIEPEKIEEILNLAKVRGEYQ